MSYRFGRAQRVTSLAFALLLAAPALGQETPPAAEPAAPEPTPSGVEEIIITSTKREENIQDVPIAVSAFTAEDLASRGIEEFDDLAAVSPSISIYGSNSSSNGGTVRIRGMGTTGNNPGLESAVGVFIDGVYRSRSGQAFNDFLDVERVEVLRGPQGTLFGKNTSAGAVQVITKKPNLDEVEGQVAAEYGNLDHKRIAGSVSGPIIDGILAYRFAASWHDRDGYYEDVNSGDAYDSRDRYTLRGQLLWAPIEAFEARLIGDWTEKEEDCCPSNYLFVGPTAAAIAQLGGTVPFVPVASVGSLNIPGNLTGLPNDYSNTGFTSNKYRDKREVALNSAPIENSTDWGVALQMDYDFDWAQMTSITSFRTFDVFRTQDVDFTDVDVLKGNYQDETFKNASQELRLLGTWEKLDWLVGAYLYTEDLLSTDAIPFGTEAGAFIGRLSWPLICPNNPTSLGLPACVTGDPLGPAPVAGFFPEDAGYTAVWNQETEGYALFSHNTFHVTEWLDFTLGFRYSREEKTADASINGGSPGQIVNDPTVSLFGLDWCSALSAAGGGLATFRAVNGAGLCDNVSWEASSTEREWTGTTSLTFHVTEDVNIYGSYSRGYKAGGFNLDQDSFDAITCPGKTAFFQALQPYATGCVEPTDAVNQWAEGRVLSTVDNTHFDPEFANAYELGLKGTFLDGRLRTNLAFFLTKFEDFQLNTFTGLGFFISNVNQVESRGVELESFLLLGESINVTFGVTYADTRYGDNTGICNVINPTLNGNNIHPITGAVITPGTYCAAAPSPAGQFPGGLGEEYPLDGHRITHSPAWTGSLGLYGEHTLPGTEWKGFASGNVQYRGRHSTASDVSPIKYQDDYWLLNMQVGIRSPEGHWEASLWSNNLTDEYINTVIFNSVFQGGNAFYPEGSAHTFFNTPRTYGGTIRYIF